MSFELTLAGTVIPTTLSALKDFKANLNLVFSLDAAMKSYLASGLALLPDNLTSNVSCDSPQGAWTPADGTVSFNLQGGVSGSMDVVRGGEKLLTYIDGLESPRETPVLAPTGHVYLRLSLRFEISASGSGNYSGGAYGVKAGGDTHDSYAITFCKAFAPTTILSDAIAQTFQSFVLPFTEHTLNDLGDGDYLAFEFDGNLNLAVGAYAGVDKVLYAGQGAADVLKAFGSPVLTLSGSVAPEVDLGGALDFKLSYATRFHALLGKVGDVGHLQLLKSNKRQTTTTLSGGLTISANGSVDVKEQLSSHLPALKTALVKFAGGAGSEGGKAIGSVVDLIPAGELQKYIDEATDKLMSWIAKADDLQCNLQVAIEKANDSVLLAGYQFDLKAPDFVQAWGFAVAGDLFSVLGTKAVTLDVNSGLEKEYRSKTSCQFNFFNLWSMTSWEEFRSKCSTIYAGNNIFHLIAEIGRTQGTEFIGAKRSMDIYFAANADADVKGKPSNLDLSLHIAVNARGDSKQIQKMANLLGLFDRNQQIAALVRDMRTFATKTKNGVAQLLFTIPGSSFAKIVADPKSGPEDAANWTQFAGAADDLEAWVLHDLGTLAAQYGLSTYPGWKTLNRALNGSTTPDRTQRGNIAAWPDEWNGISDTGQQGLIRYSMLAAQQYMNFCAAMQSLAQSQSSADVSMSWEALLKVITSAIKDDMNPDFLWPTALATIRMCKSASYVLAGPAPSTIPADHFAVSIAL